METPPNLLLLASSAKLSPAACWSAVGRIRIGPGVARASVE